MSLFLICSAEWFAKLCSVGSSLTLNYSIPVRLNEERRFDAFSLHRLILSRFSGSNHRKKKKNELKKGILTWALFKS